MFKKTIFIAMLALIATVIPAHAEDSNTQSLTGVIKFPEKVDLSKFSKIEISILDTSICDAPAPVLAKKTLTKQKGNVESLNFSINYEKTKLDPKAMYTISVLIYVKDKNDEDLLKYWNNCSISVFGKAGSKNIQVKVVKTK